MSVGATESARSTTNLANCLTLIMYLGSSESAFMILVHLATFKYHYIIKQSFIQRKKFISFLLVVVVHFEEFACQQLSPKMQEELTQYLIP